MITRVNKLVPLVLVQWGIQLLQHGGYRVEVLTEEDLQKGGSETGEHGPVGQSEESQLTAKLPSAAYYEAFPRENLTVLIQSISGLFLHLYMMGDTLWPTACTFFYARWNITTK